MLVSSHLILDALLKGQQVQLLHHFSDNDHDHDSNDADGDDDDDDALIMPPPP